MIRRLRHLNARTAMLALLGASCLSGSSPLVAAENPGWTTSNGHRSRALSVSANGKTGFQRLAATATGITFTNILTDTFAAQNRNLENGSGVALGDVDGDGLPDIYFCGLESGNALYRNLGDWKFADITQAAGVACAGQFSTGAAFADVDGDGDLDLLVNALGGGTRYFTNDGRGQFTEATDTGLLRQGGSMSLALADVDGDGDLDVYVANYRVTTVKDNPNEMKVDVKMVNGRPVVTPADRFVAIPSHRTDGVHLFELGEPDQLYLNDGTGKFSPKSWTTGGFVDAAGKPLSDPPRDWSLSALFRDVNDDGAPDLYVCNDFFYSRDQFWLNDGKGHFRPTPATAWRSMSLSAMGVDFADVNRDGHDDFFVADMLSQRHTTRHRQRGNTLKGEVILPLKDANFQPEVSRNTFYVNRGDNTFAEVGQWAGVAASEWSWSAAFLDVDLDGYEDLLITTGHAHDVTDADAMRKLSTLKPASTAQEKIAYLKEFPPLNERNILYRNIGGGKFEDKGAEWGWSNDLNVSHGLALGDLDGDGDLDVVVNELNGPVGIYRNEGNGKRVSVKLKGAGKNTQGIGAKLILKGGPVEQSQEIISGGRYLSSDEPRRVFAAGDQPMTLEVRWRSGTRTVVTNVLADHEYEISESAATPYTNTTVIPQPYYTNVSQLLNHVHVDEPFDDYARQPLLPHRLSGLGPSVSWYDLNGDGWDDLLIGGGKGGELAVYLNNQQGGFRRISLKPVTNVATQDQSTVLGWRVSTNRSAIIVGQSNYESDQAASLGTLYEFGAGSTNRPLPIKDWSSGAMALADADGDGDLDLYIGGRVKGGKYPEAVGGILLRQQANQWLEEVILGGLVSSAVWSDLDGDNQPELITTEEWGPVRVYRNQGNQLRDVTVQWGLSDTTGWWNGVATGDFDNDGHPDLIAANAGLNQRYHATAKAPARLYYLDFDANGANELIEAYYDSGLKKIVPWRELEVVSANLPFVTGAFASYREYGEASVEKILGEFWSQTKAVQATTLQTTLWLNRGGKFIAQPLPEEAQWSHAYGIAVGDYDGDGNEDVFLSQNDFGGAESRTDAGRGLWLKGDGTGKFTVERHSGIAAYGEGRGAALADYDGDGRIDLVVGQQASQTQLYRNAKAKPGLRVKLQGSANNPLAIGAKLRLTYANGQRSPLKEVQAGSGYWSQNSATTVLALPQPPASLEVTWPDGKQKSVPIGATQKEITVSAAE